MSALVRARDGCAVILAVLCLGDSIAGAGEAASPAKRFSAVANANEPFQANRRL